MARAPSSFVVTQLEFGRIFITWAAPRLGIYLAVAIGSAILFLLLATIYAALWPTPQELQTVAPAGIRAPLILWIIIIGFIAGVIARLLHPGANEPAGFILTTLLGIAGAFLATCLLQAIGWHRAGDWAGLIGAVMGAIIVLALWTAISDYNSQRI
jgi:uncharacterized membrane protein YeaQ/YmgE (transglycosylase-associated protein family)